MPAPIWTRSKSVTAGAKPPSRPNTHAGQLAHLDARRRAHARVEDRIRTAKDTGLDHFPSRTAARRRPAPVSVGCEVSGHDDISDPGVRHAG
jgi:hypothetical protein